MSNIVDFQAERRKRRGEDALAPAPQVDKYPVIIGAGLSLSYVSSALRMCLTGYRQPYVDLLDEMLEKDPHAYSVVAKRVLTLAGGRVEVTAPEGLEGTELEIAEEVAKDTHAQIQAIPNLAESLSILAWATYYAVSALEIRWARDDDGRMCVRALEQVHYRRLSYPDPWTWDLYIWDQGANFGADGNGPNRSVYGLRVDDYPGQFIVHAPKVRGDYVTREGIGRQILYWMVLKLIATRLAPQYLERYAIPFPDIEFNTADEATKHPRVASDEDIAGAKAAGAAIGAGTLKAYVHADAVKLKLVSPDGTPALTYPQWIALCDAQISKAVLGGTLTTEVGSTGGNRAVAGEQKEGEEKLYDFDATTFGDTLKRDLAGPIARMRYPGLPRRLEPVVKVHVNADPDPADEIDRADKAARAGIPVDADEIAKRTNLPVIKNTTNEPRRMIPILPVKMNVQPETIGLPKPPEPPPGTLPQNQPPQDAAQENDDAGNDSDA
jgi:phage gp29-like protein